MSARTPRKNNAATAALVRGRMADVLSSVRMASNETMAEMIPMRERDRIRAVKIRMARKSQNTTDTSSVRETNLRKTAASPEKPFNKSCRSEEHTSELQSLTNLV